ncbi:hypothetical protein PF005_g5614 [Phytophthora fragariae]|uniref:Uncharacterized protein n=1 Tax=Phytophthora fragariae TaxID=53985 RepID=A0A6A3YPC1_9STRA|nr:hypothetical protein PF003_g30705 [Phytophthora fragariae]KAE8938905.1 hypothetical protein PF009_g11253 [Phytophthora fragariae]KAE9011590.1 hypothetical protein PF011_g9301 [Phytophthora fragariae]KAE9083773.1 hypothetical protein PF006_g26614 [Phytophthora fragariae]KAE9113398.1 hypothetical protein PF010_g10077 [Phytophthora fragariae]
MHTCRLELNCLVLVTLSSSYLLLSICKLNPCLDCDHPQRLALVNRRPLSTTDP